MRRLAPVLALVLATPGCTGKPERAPDAEPVAGFPVAPELTGKTVTGETISLADLRGRVVLLNAWATWCEPCKKELPELARLHQSREQDGLTVLGVSVDKVRLLPEVRRLMKDNGVTYPVIFDPDGQVVGAFQIRGYPTSFIIGRDGTLRWRRDGIIEENDGEVGKQLKLVLSEPAPAPTDAKVNG